MLWIRAFTIKIVTSICVLWIIVQLVTFYYTSNNFRAFDVSNNSQNQPTYGRNFIFRPYTKKTFGEFGRPVLVPAGLQAESKRTFNLNYFNLVASDLIGIHRELPDYRHASCPVNIVVQNLIQFKTSIIIVFHNEAWSALLRTIHSAIERAPHELIEEIILVDDASTQDHLHQRLDDYVKQLKTRIHVERLTKRSGLISARLRGAELAKGKTLTFLDAHCEATKGWLEALLLPLIDNPKRIVCPIIDVIKYDSFQYFPGSDETWGSFDWYLNFHWGTVPERELQRVNRDHFTPRRTPTMAGGLFTIMRDYFYELGAYDSGMRIWGGENIELSFRAWQCGAELLIAPCSHIGHIFRKHSPYSWPGGVGNILNRNFARTALVWLDDYKELYFRLNPASRTTDYGDIRERLELRKRLNCKSFKWYLDNIFPESSFPTNAIRFGAFMHPYSGQCLDRLGHNVNEVIGIAVCHNLGGNQAFAFTSTEQIRVHQGCLDAGLTINAATGTIMIKDCDDKNIGQKFFTFGKQLKHRATNLCLVVISLIKGKRLTLKKCANTPEFEWVLPPIFTTQSNT